jgi:hypothetical protein
MLLLAALAVPACSNQGEGERCDTRGENGGNDDCLDGLKCTRADTLGTGASADLCCPVDRTKATTAGCKLPPAPAGGDASIPPLPDGATPDVVTSDAPADGAPDGVSDAAGDAAGDAPADAPGEGG